MLEEKKWPFVITHTTLTCLSSVEMLELKPDNKKDDYLLSGSNRDMDNEEPPCIGRDSHS